MIHEKDASPTMKCSLEAFAFKEKMLDAIMESGLLHKQVAYGLGYEPSDLSHWLSVRCESTMPGHLLPQFCRLVGNLILAEHVDARMREAA